MWQRQRNNRDSTTGRSCHIYCRLLPTLTATATAVATITVQRTSTSIARPIVPTQVAVTPVSTVTPAPVKSTYLLPCWSLLGLLGLFLDVSSAGGPMGCPLVSGTILGDGCLWTWQELDRVRLHWRRQHIVDRSASRLAAGTGAAWHARGSSPLHPLSPSNDTDALR